MVSGPLEDYLDDPAVASDTMILASFYPTNNQECHDPNANLFDPYASVSLG
jgi:hypothetical protein